VDNLTPKERSQQMALVRSKDTKPELVVRRLIHSLGYRYRLHRADLPGKPDLVFPSRGKVIFVHGCFWHGHKCRLGRMPKSSLDYWLNKIAYNRNRDKRILRHLRKLGWESLVVWECRLRSESSLVERIERFLES
jgi:DNA mismatch endonuclease (patch repair protein)